MTTFIFTIILSLSAVAHEELDTLKCKSSGLELDVYGAPVGYLIELRKGDQIIKKFPLSDFAINDFFDQKYKQIFDVYTGKNDNVYLQIKRPETKGPITGTVAILKYPPDSKDEKQFSDCDLKSTKNKK